MSTNEINLDELTRYDNLVNERENSKIRALPVVTKNDYVKYFFNGARDGKVYGVKFPYDSNDIIQATAGVKYGANAGLVVEPSTRTVVSRDDYSDINLFRGIDANVHLDSEGNVIIDYLQGDDEFSYYGKVNVVRLFPSLYERVYDEVETVGGVDTKWFHIEWTDTPKSGFTLNPLCKKIDGSNRGFFGITKYQAGMIDNVLYASAGLYPWNSAHITTAGTSPCYSLAISKYHDISIHQCPMVMAQYCYLQRVFLLKYAHTNFNLKLGGVTNYNYSRQVYSNGTHNYILIQSPGDIYPNVSLDLHTNSSRQSDLLDTFEVLSKDTSYGTWPNINNSISISDSSYTITSETFVLTCKTVDGQVVDPDGNPISISFAHNGEPVDVTFEYTSARKLNVYDNGTQIATTTATASTSYAVIYTSKPVTAASGNYVHTSVYTTGYSSGIRGTDGCYMVGAFSQTPRFPSVLSGIEIMGGCSDLIGNIVIEYDGDHKGNVLVCNDPTKITDVTASITEDYSSSNSYFLPTTSGANLKGVINVTYDLEKGTYGGTCGTGGSTTTGLCDSVYFANATSGRYQAYGFGQFGQGDHDGLFFLCINDLLTKTSSVTAMATRPAFISKF